MEASGEGNFSVSMNTSSSAPFQEERLGLYPGGVHVKIQMGMLVQIFRFEIWANPIVFQGSVENWRYFFRLRKATAT